MKIFFAFILLISAASAMRLNLALEPRDRWIHNGSRRPGYIPELSQELCRCSLGAQSRIVGGKIAIPNEVPWQVSLSSHENEHFCGGVIINAKLILTAAHCIVEVPMNETFVRVGLHHLNEPRNERRIHDIVNYFIHPGYSTNNYVGDIAILQLRTAIDFEIGITEPACFNFERVLPGTNLMASGWGSIDYVIRNHTTGLMHNLNSSNVLKKAEYSATVCADEFVCGEDVNRGSVCLGDSGGPLHITRNGLTKVVGLSSNSVDRIEMPEFDVLCSGKILFTSVSYYKPFMDYFTKENYCFA